MNRMIATITAIAAVAAANAAGLLPDGEAELIAREKLAKMTLEEKVSLCGLCATMYLNAIPEQKGSDLIATINYHSK